MCPFGVSFCESGYFPFLSFWETDTSLLFQPCPLVLYWGGCSLSIQVSCCFLCIWVFLLNMCVSHVCMMSADVRRESTGSSGTEWLLEWIPGPLQEHEAPLSTESSLQSPLKSFGQNLRSLFLRNELCSRSLHDAESTDWHWVSSAIALHRNFWGKVSYRLGQQASWIPLSPPLQWVCRCAQHFHSARIPAQPLHLCANLLIFSKDTSSNECVYVAF